MLRKKITALFDKLSMIWVVVNFIALELKEDESAMEVIQVVMLIAVGVLAIAAIWAGINGLLEEWWTMIIGSKSQSGPSITP